MPVSERGGVWVVPLFSWHHSSWDTGPDVTSPQLPPVSAVAADYRRCVWPHPLRPDDTSLALHFDRLNDDGAGGARVDMYLIIFLKFIQSVVPTMNYDFTAEANIG